MPVDLKTYTEQEKDDMFIKLIAKYPFGLTATEIFKLRNKKNRINETANRLNKLVKKGRLVKRTYGHNQVFRIKTKRNNGKSSSS